MTTRLIDAVAVLLAGVVVAGCGGDDGDVVTCGAGTVRVGATCVAAPADSGAGGLDAGVGGMDGAAGDPDARPPHDDDAAPAPDEAGRRSDGARPRRDAGPVDPEDVERYSSFGLHVVGGVSLGDVARVPAGGQVAMQMYGSDALGRSFPLRSGSFAVVPDDGTVRVATRSGIGYFVGLREGRVLVRGSVVTSLGVRTEEREIQVDPAVPITLRAVGAPAGPVLDARNRLYRETENPQPTAVPPSLGAQIYARLEWGESGGFEGGSSEVHLDDVELRAGGEDVHVDRSGLVTAAATGTGHVELTFAPEGTSLLGPEAALDVRFVDEAPAVAVSVATYRGGDAYPVVRSTLPSGAPPPMRRGPELGNLSLQSDFPAPSLLVGVVHETAGVAYTRWVDPADWVVRTTGDDTAFAVEADGQLRWLHSGVGLWTVDVAGYSGTVLVASRVAPDVTLTLRAEPDRLAFVLPDLPSGPLDCSTTVRLFVTEGDAPEREVAGLERLAVERSAGAEPYGTDILGGFSMSNAPDGVTFCTPTARYMGVSSPASGTVRMYFLNGSIMHSALSLPYTVTFAPFP